MKSLWQFFRRNKAIAQAEVVELNHPKTFVATMSFEDDDGDWDDEDDEDDEDWDDEDDGDWDDEDWDDEDDDWD